MDQAFSSRYVQIRTQGGIGRITLSRPEALNALNMEMVRSIAVALDQWEADDAIKAVLIDGDGERAFCAGGDIKLFYKSGMDYRKGNISLDTAMVFFREEYALNARIFHYKKPLIAFMHGLTMGGGFGLAGNARYRIAAPDTMFAMPEAKIGFFPDVGSIYHLRRLPHRLGLALALSGISLNAADMLRYGVAHFGMVRPELDGLAARLQDVLVAAQGDAAAHGAVRDVLGGLAGDFPAFSGRIAGEESRIEQVFSAGSLQAILDGAQGMDGFTGEAAQAMAGNSPLSMAVAYAYYHKADLVSFDDIITQDFILAKNFAKGLDFYEGIRAAVIDKDRNPQWSVNAVAESGDQEITAYFIE